MGSSEAYKTMEYSKVSDSFGLQNLEYGIICLIGFRIIIMFIKPIIDSLEKCVASFKSISDTFGGSEVVTLGRKIFVI